MQGISLKVAHLDGAGQLLEGCLVAGGHVLQQLVFDRVLLDPSASCLLHHLQEAVPLWSTTHTCRSAAASCLGPSHRRLIRSGGVAMRERRRHLHVQQEGEGHARFACSGRSPDPAGGTARNS